MFKLLIGFINYCAFEALRCLSKKQ